jgi:hypothetical protein
MLTFKNLSEMRGKVDEEIFKEFEAVVRDSNLEDESFMETLGGDVFVVETTDDLKDVYIGYDDKDQPLDIRNTADVVDSAFYFPSKNWILIFVATNNAGGSSYIIPKDIADLYVTIETCIEKTNQYWSAQGNCKQLKQVQTFRGPLVEVVRVSPASGLINTRYLPFTQEQYNKHLLGELIQVALPQLTKDEAEFVMTGIPSEEWNLMFPPEDE